MRQEEIQEIIQYMTSFYGENLPIGSSFETLVDIYMKLIAILWDEVEYYHQHVAVEDAPTLKKIPYMKLSVSEGIYDKRVAQTIQSLTFEEQISYLNESGYFVQFTFDGDDAVRTPIVYNMTLMTEFNNENSALTLYDDYFIRDNRVYFTPQFVMGLNRNLETLHAVDVRVDNFLLEKKWGTLFNVETGNFLPRYQYRDILSAYKRLLSSNLTIRDIKEAIQLATKWEDFNVQDIKSPTLPPSLKRLYDDWLISPARFLVTLNEELIKDKIRLNMMLSLLDEAKEEHVNYLILFHIVRNDVLDNCVDTSKIGYSYSSEDVMDGARDETRILYKYKVKDFFRLPHAYDVGRSYDNELQYDFKEVSSEGVVMDVDGSIMDSELIILDRPWLYNSDFYEVRHIEFPKIPRNLTVLKEGDNLVFTFDENADGTRLYELYGSQEERGTYEKLAEVASTENPTNSIIHNASLDGMRYYKIRAVANTDISLFTLAIDETTL